MKMKLDLIQFTFLFFKLFHFVCVCVCVLHGNCIWLEDLPRVTATVHLICSYGLLVLKEANDDKWLFYSIIGFSLLNMLSIAILSVLGRHF